MILRVSAGTSMSNYNLNSATRSRPGLICTASTIESGIDSNDSKFTTMALSLSSSLLTGIHLKSAHFGSVAASYYVY
jgi:hypothetical protein